MTKKEIVARKVDRGIKLLDREAGKRWARKINLKDFELTNWMKCPLGQLYGEYSLGAKALTLSLYDQGKKNVFAYGFNVNNYADAPLLEAEWKRRIRLRQRRKVAKAK